MQCQYLFDAFFHIEEKNENVFICAFLFQFVFTGTGMNFKGKFSLI